MITTTQIISYIDKLSRNTFDSELFEKKTTSIVIFLTWLKNKKLLNEADYSKIVAYIGTKKEEKTKNNVTINNSYNGSIKPQVSESQNSLRFKIFDRRNFLVILLFYIFLFIFLLLKQNINPKLNFSQKKQNGRILSYSGKLTDSAGKPIDYKTDTYFRLYTNQTAVGPIYVGACLGENALVPSYNGSFSLLIGSDCGMKEIPEEIFSSTKDLFLGITVGSDSEMKPRQKIAKVGYALQADKLKGMTLGSQTSSIPFIDENGRLLIEASSPTLKASSGLFNIEGEALTIKTTNGSILINPQKDTIVSSGNFGIGVFEPQAKLDVAGDASISGSLNFSSIFTQINQLNGGDLFFSTSTGSQDKSVKRIVLTNQGNLGIGTVTPHYLFSVENNNPGSPIASLTNKSIEDTKQTGILRMNLGTKVSGTSASFIEFFGNSQSDITGTNVGKIRINNGGVAYETSGADFAEYFSIGEDVEAGEIIGLTETLPMKATDNNKLLGVVTDLAGFIGNSPENFTNSEKTVGLLGQIDTKVSSLNGSINSGDPITSSSIAGFGTKALIPGEIVGKALESTINLTDDRFNNNYCPEEYKNILDTDGNKIKCGKIKVFVKVSWYDPIIASNQALSPFISSSNSSNEINTSLANELSIEAINNILSKQSHVLSLGDKTITTINYYSKLFVGQIEAGLVSTKDIISTGTISSTNFVGNTIYILTGEIKSLTADNISAIEGSIDSLLAQKITSPIIESEKVITNELQTEKIKPKDQIVEIDLSSPENEKDKFASVVIKGIDEKVVSSIDNQGNATFAGTLTAKEASIEGELRAKKVLADNITDLENNISSLEGNFDKNNQRNTQLSTDLEKIKTELASLPNNTLPNPEYYQNLETNNSLTDVNIDKIEAMTSIQENLTVYNQADIFNANISNKLTVGEIVFDKNTILSLSWNLRFNSLSTIDFFDGLITLSKDGSLTTKGQIIAEAGLKTSNIESKDADITLKLNKKDAEESKLSIVDKENKEVAHINDKGQAYFNELTLNSYLEGTDEGKIISAEDNFKTNGIFSPSFEAQSYTAGTAILPENSNDVIIYTSQVSGKSLLYLTPTSSSPVEGLTVVEKEDCADVEEKDNCRTYFRVTAKKDQNTKVTFNWLIIN